MNEETKPFAEFKADIIAKCKENNACEAEFKKLLRSENYQQLWEVLISNHYWCNENKIFSQRPKVFEFSKDFGGSLDLHCCDLKGITLPENIGRDLDLRGCEISYEILNGKFKDKIIK